jgi:hypothetical protein
VQRRVLGDEHPHTLTSANNLALSLSRQGKHAEAERIQREVLGASVQRRVLGEEHPETLTSAVNLASSLSGQGKHAEAERIKREVLGVERRVLGDEHPSTLTTAVRAFWHRRSRTKGSTRRRSGSAGRCLVQRGGYSARSTRRR